jgi:sterol desaturase/sphingolipid hydroxylase (fatty acid hydroxylase superfamily)
MTRAAMAFDPATVSDAAPPRADMTRPRLEAGARAVGRTFWVSVGIFGALVLMCLVLAVVSFGTYQVDDASGEMRFDWIAGLLEFVSRVYQRGVFQITIALLLIGLLLEKCFPARLQNDANRGLNIPYGLMVVLFITATGPLQLLIADWIFHWTGGSSLFDLRFETNHRFSLALAAMLLSALIGDFFFYWFHRLQHVNRLLWQAHILHHTDTALNVTTTNRTHLFEHILAPFFMATPITLLFSLPRSDIIAVSVLPIVWSHVVHMNIRLGFGKLWWLLSSPQYHRIHHSILHEHRNRNFAVWFPIWDIVFRTAYVPRPGEYPETGADGVEVSTVTEALKLPIVRWYRMNRPTDGGERPSRTGHGV